MRYFRRAAALAVSAVLLAAAGCRSGTPASPAASSRPPGGSSPAPVSSVSASPPSETGSSAPAASKPADGDPSVPAEAGRTPGRAYIVPVKYPDGYGPVTALYDAAEDFGVKGDGVTDNTAALQKALDATGAQGGGVLYLPEGRYYFAGTLTVPDGVTLRGEWKSPDDAPAGSCGTVLLTNAGHGSEEGDPFLTLRTGGGLRNLTIFYPNQLPEEPAPYPPAVQQDSNSATLINVTILGAWTAVRTNPQGNEQHTLRNVYLSPYKTGLSIDACTDIGRLEGVHIRPRYLQENAVKPFDETSKADAAASMLEEATGILMYRSDWEYVYNVDVEGLRTGLTVMQSAAGAANAQFMKLSFADCRTGISLVAANGIGLSFTDVEITASRAQEAGIVLQNSFSSAAMFDNITIRGPFANPLKCRGRGTAVFTNSTFSGWPDTAAAVECDGGGLSLQQCRFEGKRGHVRVLSGSGPVSVLDCTFGGTPDCTASDGYADRLTVDASPLNLPERSGQQHTYRPSIPAPSASRLYDVLDYGAENLADCTEAFEKALAAAGKTGGIVYVPAGQYRITRPLIVPTGVELRGCNDVPTHSMHKGTVLLVDTGLGDENGTPFLRLQEGAGVRGLSFYHLGQDYEDFVPFPWTVQSLGKNCWAIDVVFLNAYNGLDFASHPSDGHYIQSVAGCVLRRGVYAGGSEGEGWMENVHFNPHYWSRSEFHTLTGNTFSLLLASINESLDAIILAGGATEHVLGTFAYGANNAFLLDELDGKGINALVIGHGSDGCRTSVAARQAGRVEFLNAQLVCMASDKEKSYYQGERSVTGEVSFFNALVWGQPDISFVSRGGSLRLSLVHFCASGRAALECAGGQAVLASSLLTGGTSHLTLGNGARGSALGCLLPRTGDYTSRPALTTQGETAGLTVQGAVWG